MRNKHQQIWDRIVLMHLLHAAQSGGVVDNIKVQKLMFMAQVEGDSRGLSIAPYSFERRNYGPYSSELAGEVLLLEELCLVDPETRELTGHGQQLLKDLRREIEKSAAAREVLDVVFKICEQHKHRESRTELVEFVHGMVVPVAGWGNEPVVVRDIPLRVAILRPHDRYMMKHPPLPGHIIHEIENEFVVPHAERRHEDQTDRLSVCDTD